MRYSFALIIAMYCDFGRWRIRVLDCHGSGIHLKLTRVPDNTCRCRASLHANYAGSQKLDPGSSFTCSYAVSKLAVQPTCMLTACQSAVFDSCSLGFVQHSVLDVRLQIIVGVASCGAILSYRRNLNGCSDNARLISAFGDLSLKTCGRAKTDICASVQSTWKL